ncbi:hotdog domain-containing protein [Lentilactobacillus sp. TOM.63]|uniref:acyl-CoA thioesterase n=1 Tax=Lentilactobacillus TaxID=2767893 RepID=UPI00201BCEC3|nr:MULTISPECIES: hotdog domain-containing protein [Lentilactobacillus]MDM7516386.1 hotdog domain-containing protein [Lentilactobacillus sp. TOM.63]
MIASMVRMMFLEAIFIEKMTCAATYAIHESYIFPADLNNGGIQFGGKTLEILDANAGLAAAKFIPADLDFVTAGYDHIQFVSPATPEDILKCTSYVTGADKRSVEVFIKFLTFNKQTRAVRPAFIAFCTLIVMANPQQIQFPKLVPESAEEKFICGGFQDRLASRHTELAANQTILKHLSN